MSERYLHALRWCIECTVGSKTRRSSCAERQALGMAQKKVLVFVAEVHQSMTHCASLCRMRLEMADGSSGDCQGQPTAITMSNSH